MSLHPSLKIDSAGAKQRSVLTRIERIKDLMKKGLWKSDQFAIGLPKTKIIRIKAAKAKKEETAEAGAAPAAAGAAVQPAQGASGAKPAAAAKPAKEAKK